MILFQMHIMWYEAEMLNETFDSVYSALKYASNTKVKLCFNSQTYIEKPVKGSSIEMFDAVKTHPLTKANQAKKKAKPLFGSACNEITLPVLISHVFNHRITISRAANRINTVN